MSHPKQKQNKSDSATNYYKITTNTDTELYLLSEFLILKVCTNLNK